MKPKLPNKLAQLIEPTIQFLYPFGNKYTDIILGNIDLLIYKYMEINLQW